MVAGRRLQRGGLTRERHASVQRQRQQLLAAAALPVRRGGLCFQQRHCRVAFSVPCKATVTSVTQHTTDIRQVSLVEPAAAGSSQVMTRDWDGDSVQAASQNELTWQEQQDVSRHAVAVDAHSGVRRTPHIIGHRLVQIVHLREARIRYAHTLQLSWY